MNKSSIISGVLSVLVVCGSLLLTSCEGPEGAVGPAGPAGPTGASGPAGPAGQTGNANVIQFTYAARTWAAASYSFQQFGFPGDITPAIMNNSVILVYMTPASNPSNTTPYNWYLIPGTVLSTDRAGHEFYFETAFGRTPAEGTPTINVFRKIASASTLTATTRIILIPANDIRNGRKAAVDFSDYNAVKEFYDLKD